MPDEPGSVDINEGTGIEIGNLTEELLRECVIDQIAGVHAKHHHCQPENNGQQNDRNQETNFIKSEPTDDRQNNRDGKIETPFNLESPERRIDSRDCKLRAFKHTGERGLEPIEEETIEYQILPKLGRREIATYGKRTYKHQPERGEKDYEQIRRQDAPHPITKKNLKRAGFMISRVDQKTT